MTIKTFIQHKILLERLQKSEILVVYDKDSLYRSLPASLKDVPRASDDARPLVESLCETLRTNVTTQILYVDRGEDIDKARAIINRHSKSVWVSRGESNAQWELIRAAVNLVEAAADADRQLPDNKNSLEILISFYAGSLREVDRLHREFHEAFRDLVSHQETLKTAAARADKAYRQLMDKVQGLFIRLVEQSTWPPQGLKSNARTFDDFVGARLFGCLRWDESNIQKSFHHQCNREMP